MSAPSAAASSLRETPTDIQQMLTSLSVRKRRHVGAIIGGAALAILVIMFGIDVATNPAFGWEVVTDYLFSPQILQGVWLTIVMTVVSMTAGIGLGIVLAIMRVSTNPVFATVSRAYVWFFRGTPLLVQLIFWYNIGALYPVIALGLPLGGPSIVLGSANVLITPLAAALLGLSLNEAAYMAEIIRSGISSVEPGQLDAAKAIGMTRRTMMRRVILPQAMRIVIPPTGNQVISMLKGTSLVSVLAITDLLYAAQTIYALNYQTIPLLLVACVWYLVMTTALTAVQARLEARFGRGFAPRKTARGKSVRTNAQNQEESA
ncbi:MAG TPA: amino acid ABC transporter permease [Nakamurella sp.]